MISIVMANYNGARFLEAALDSVLAQEHAAFECILVDDGSTDTSPEIMRRYAEAHPGRVRALAQPENRGQGAAINLGISAARGELVAFLDSDDLWMPHKLARVQEMAGRDPDAAFYCHNLYLHVDGAPTRQRFRDVIVTGDVFGHVQRTGWFPQFVPTSGLVFPKRVLEKVLPIPEGFRTCADGYLTRAAMVFGRVAGTDECWGYYRRHGTNAVLGSHRHDNVSYREELLIPALNAFYAREKIGFRFPGGPRWKQTLERQARRLMYLLRG